MDDRTLALLGNRAAQERITECGELLPCPYCGEKPSTRTKSGTDYVVLSVVCFNCGHGKSVKVEILDTDFQELNKEMRKTVELWNTRAPILTPEQIKRLEELE